MASPEICGRLGEAEIDAALDPAGYLGLAGEFVDQVLAHARAARA